MSPVPQAQRGDGTQLVADDIFVTNPAILQTRHRGARGQLDLIKLNQIGTVTETLETIRRARQASYRAVVSHRSGHVRCRFCGRHRGGGSSRRPGELRTRERNTTGCCFSNRRPRAWGRGGRSLRPSRVSTRSPNRARLLAEVRRPSGQPRWQRRASRPRSCRRSRGRSPRRSWSGSGSPSRAGTVAAPVAPRSARRKSAVSSSWVVEAVGEVEHVGDEETLTPRSSSARTTWRAISDPSRSLVEANDSLHSSSAARRDLVGDLAHPGELLVELAALHRRVLLALVVGEHAVADVGAQRLGGDEHAGLASSAAPGRCCAGRSTCRPGWRR